MKKRSSPGKSQKRIAKSKRTQEHVTIGIDLGDKTSRYCMLNNEGEILREGQVTTSKAGMVESFGSLRTGPDRHRGRNPFTLSEPLIAGFGT